MRGGGAWSGRGKDRTQWRQAAAPAQRFGGAYNCMDVSCSVGRSGVKGMQVCDCLTLLKRSFE